MDSSTGTGAGIGMGIIFAILFYAALFGFAGWMYWKIALKAGYPGLYGLSVFVPILNIVALIVFVFKPWPIEEELARLRAGAGGFGGGYPPVGGGYPGHQGVQYQQPVPRMGPPPQAYGAPAFEEDYDEAPAPHRPVAPQQYPGAGPVPQPPTGYRQPPPYGSGGGLPTRPGR